MVDLAVAHRDDHPLQRTGGRRRCRAAAAPGRWRRPRAASTSAHWTTSTRVCVGVGRCSSRPISSGCVPLGRDVGVRPHPGGGEEDVDRDEQVGDHPEHRDPRQRDRGEPPAAGQRAGGRGRAGRRSGPRRSRRRPPGRTRRRRCRCSRRSAARRPARTCAAPSAPPRAPGRRGWRRRRRRRAAPSSSGLLAQPVDLALELRAAQARPGRRTAAPPRPPRSARPTRVEITGAFGSLRVEYMRNGPNGNASSSPQTVPASSRARTTTTAARPPPAPGRASAGAPPARPRAGCRGRTAPAKARSGPAPTATPARATPVAAPQAHGPTHEPRNLRIGSAVVRITG